MLKPSDIAARWGVPVSVIYRMIRQGRMATLNLSPGSRGGKGLRYLVSYRVVRALEASRDDPVPTDGFA